MARPRDRRRGATITTPTSSVTKVAEGRSAALIALVLALVSVAIYAPTFVVPYDFVSLDDQEYVEGNYMVASGLNLASARWAMTNVVAGHWHPLTILSHMLDVEVYGLHPAGHHLTSVALHAVNGVLLFYVLWRMTSSLWPSAWVAALFAWHPLRVESVAWIAERKDVLSTFFMLLALAAYTRYAHRGGWRPYLMTTVCFTLGLAAKAMLVTFPFVLLLLDVWPLRRWNPSHPSQGALWKTPARSLLEKLPWFAISAAFIARTMWAATGAYSDLTFTARLANAIGSYYAYLGKAFFPYPLYVPYIGIDRDPSIVWVLVGGAGLLLATVGSLLAVKRWPFVTVGWLWYLGILVPVSGIMQVGGQKMADRYTYVSLVGIYIIVAWSLAEIAARSPAWTRVTVGLAIAVLPPIIALAAMQVTYWHDTKTLFEHTLHHSPTNDIAHVSLGVEAMNDGDFESALRHGQRAAELSPSSHVSFRIVAMSLARVGRTSESMPFYAKAIEMNRGNVELMNELARILATCDNASVRNGAAALQLARRANDSYQGKNPVVLDTMATAYAELGAYDAAISTTKQALAIARQVVGTGHTDAQPLIDGLEYRLTLYRQRQPYHVPLGVWDF